MKEKTYSLTDKIIISIIRCLSEAIGDDVKGCLRRENINDKYSNGKKLIKWDFINRNFAFIWNNYMVALTTPANVKTQIASSQNTLQEQCNYFNNIIAKNAQ